MIEKLVKAIENREFVKAEAIIKKNPSVVFKCDDDGNTPLHHTVIQDILNYSTMVELLMFYKADAYAENNLKQTPLGLAKLFGKTTTAKIMQIKEQQNYRLLKIQGSPLDNPNKALFDAISSHNLTKLVEALRCGADIEAKLTGTHLAFPYHKITHKVQNKTPLEFALLLLFDFWNRVVWYAYTAFDSVEDCYKIQKDLTAIILKLLELGADPNATGFKDKLMEEACGLFPYEVIEALLKAKINIPNKELILSLAEERLHHSKEVVELIQKYLTINKKSLSI